MTLSSPQASLRMQPTSLAHCVPSGDRAGPARFPTAAPAQNAVLPGGDAASSTLACLRFYRRRREYRCPPYVVPYRCSAPVLAVARFLAAPTAVRRARDLSRLSPHNSRTKADPARQPARSHRTTKLPSRLARPRSPAAGSLRDRRDSNRARDRRPFASLEQPRLSRAPLLSQVLIGQGRCHTSALSTVQEAGLDQEG